jgi:hypothetical protein
MTFQYFIGTIIFAFAMNLFVVAAFDGVLGLFYRSIGSRYLRVVVKNDGINF